MPTYEYACGTCGHEWEETQRITEPPTETCPACAKATAHRLISAGTNFILKGSGWYSDLYASPKPSANAEGKADKADQPDKAEKAEKAEKADKPEKTEKRDANPATSAAPSSASSKPGTSTGSSGTPASPPANTPSAASS